MEDSSPAVGPTSPMSQASQGGSPPAQIDGADFARRMVQATEAATMAAESAAKALADLQSKGSREDKSWYKVLPKPGSFDAKTREEELSMWRDFSWSLEQYMASLDTNYTDDFQNLRDHPDRDVDERLMSEEEKSRSAFLYSLLASLLKHRPLMVLRQVVGSNGLEAYRQLLVSLEPVSRNRSLGLLNMILGWSPFESKKSTLSQLLRLEDAFREYEKTGASLSDEIKFAVLMRCLSGQLKTWLQLQVADSGKYTELREAIIKYDRATQKWSDTMILGGGDVAREEQLPTPMEVDRMEEKGKGGSKGKGKQKGKQKGKDSWHDGNWSKGKNSGKGKKGYDQKGKGRGKGDATYKGKGKGKACFVCGKTGHVAKECYQAKGGWGVRQVAEAQPAQEPAASTATSPTSPSTTQKTASVKRVSLMDFPSGSGEPLIFDIRGEVAKETEKVRMVQFFSIADSEDEADIDPKVHTVQKVEDKEDCSFQDETYKIILDSGSDATVLPSSLLSAGQSSSGGELRLQDAQGEEIKLSGYKDVSFFFETEEGKTVEVRDKAHFADGVSQPIISYGRLMQAGWDIDSANQSLVFGNGGSRVRIPIALQNKSLVIHGTIRAIRVSPLTVRMLEAKFNEELEEKVQVQKGWKMVDRCWMGVHLSKNFQDPQLISGVDQSVDWLRTTLVKENNSWQLKEMCEPIHGLEVQDEAIEGLTENVLVVTFLTRDDINPETFGFQVEDALVPQVDMKDYEIPVEEAADGQPALELHDEAVRMEEEQVDPVLQEGRMVLAEAVPEKLVVNGVDLDFTSKLKELRAACQFFGVSQSGSKLTCYRRLQSHLKERELKAAAEAVALAQREVGREPRPQPLIAVPSQEEQMRHKLVHTPYAAWCPECLLHRGLQDRHLRSGASRLSGVPIISIDFCYTKNGVVAGGPQEGQPVQAEGPQQEVAERREGREEVAVVEGPDQAKPALWMVMVCSQTGYLGAVPLKFKNQINLMAKEIMTFCQNLGHDEVGFYGDNEPTVRSLLRVLLNSRHALGLRTRIFTTKVRDSAGNSLAENAVQRIRSLACTLMEEVFSNTGIRLNMNHGLWSWAARHACWILNRYQASRGVTGYELIHGKSYSGAIVPFGCPVYAFVKPKGGKGDPRWRMSLFLGKTEAQDAWVVGDGEQVILTRSLRRIDRPWSKFLAYYQNFNTFSWEYQVNFGGRVVPSKRAAGAIPLRRGELPPEGLILGRFPDEEAEAVKKYAKSLEGLAEAQQELEDARQGEVAVAPQPFTPELEDIVIPEAGGPSHPSGGPLPSAASEPFVFPPLSWDDEPTGVPVRRRNAPPPSNAAFQNQTPKEHESENLIGAQGWR